MASWSPWPCRRLTAAVFPGAPDHPYIALSFMTSASHSPSQWWPWVGLDVTEPHPDTSGGGWEASQMFWWEKGGVFSTPKEPSKLTYHPHRPMSVLVGHMAGRRGLLQSLPHCHMIRGSFLSSPTFHHYRVFVCLA